MSRFTVGQEITVKESSDHLTYGRFYVVCGIEIYSINRLHEACVRDNNNAIHIISDDFGLTREEYEQAEREKDPFAPGKWVVCVEDDYPLSSGAITQVWNACRADDKWFNAMTHDGVRGMRKYRFRPATPEEIKEQEKKIMDEKKADDEKIEIAHVFQIDPDILTPGWRERMAESERQTFTVGGQEFYVGQTVWTTMNLGIGDKGTALVVVGCDLANKTAIIVKEPDTVKAFSITADGRITTTDPKLHKWKFGDWARHPDYGVGFVSEPREQTGSAYVSFGGNLGVKYVGLKSLTYISTAEIPE